ncbi:MAG: PDZ domain-containing protein, partial [Cellulophaga sp.]|nr:PDZ domain-containing protein [Cellulophaga sp.]
MKNKLAYALLMMLFAVASCSFTKKSFENDDKDKLLLDLITYVLEKGHYQSKDIDDDFSVHIFEDFIDGLDPTKRYFLADDIKDFEQYKFSIDDQIKNTDITFFNTVYERLIKRMEEAKGIYKEVLAEPFDYDVKENIDIDYEKQSFVSSRKELKERWRKQLKYATLGNYDSKITAENSNVTETKTVKNDIVETSVKGGEILNAKDKKPLSKKEAEKEAREDTAKTLDEFFEFVADLERKDWFVQYLNTIVEEFDPHTFYFAPEEKEKFDTRMSGKFEGIGARLQKRTEGIKIVEIISGGPVWRDKKIEVGDEILKVGQDGEAPISIVGMRLDDAIKLIKGAKGTVVDLTIRKVDGNIEVISITRDVVELEETFAKSANIIKNDQ